VLAVVAGASLLGARSNPVLFKGNFVQQAVAQQLNLQGLPFAGQDMKLAPKILAILETRDYVCRNYVNPSTGQSVELLVVFSPDNRKATHPPDVCLEGNGQSIIDRRKQQIDLSDGSAIPMKELLTQRGSDLRYYLYVYKCGTQYTPDFFSQQANIFFNSLLNQNTSGALIRFSLPVTGRNLEEARSLAFSAVRSIIPQLNRGLP
jgi:EpsI family protein